jgi:hypothetical protein
VAVRDRLRRLPIRSVTVAAGALLGFHASRLVLWPLCGDDPLRISWHQLIAWMDPASTAYIMVAAVLAYVLGAVATWRLSLACFASWAILVGACLAAVVAFDLVGRLDQMPRPHVLDGWVGGVAEGALLVVMAATALALLILVTTVCIKSRVAARRGAQFAGPSQAATMTWTLQQALAGVLAHAEWARTLEQPCPEIRPCPEH